MRIDTGETILEQSRKEVIEDMVLSDMVVGRPGNSHLVVYTFKSITM